MKVVTSCRKQFDDSYSKYGPYTFYQKKEIIIKKKKKTQFFRHVYWYTFDYPAIFHIMRVHAEQGELCQQNIMIHGIIIFFFRLCHNRG